MKIIELSNRRWAMLLVALFTLLSAAVHSMAEQVAFVSDQASPWSNWDIYLRDLASGATARLSTNSAIDNHPDLSPDGQRVVFSSTRGSGEFDLWLGNVTNVEATAQQLTFHAHTNGSQTLYPSRHPHFHPNGTTIIFTSKNRPLDSPITIVSECSSPKIIIPPRFYEGLNTLQLDAAGNVTNYLELDIRDAWNSASFPDIWVPGTGTYVGHPSFSHGGDRIVFAGSIDGDGKVWEVYVANFDSATGSLIANSLRRVTKGPDTGPNPIKMSAGAHFTEDDSQILFSSTRTAMGNSQIFRLPATAVDAPVTSALQMTSHPANDYVPEALMDGSFIVTSDLGTNGLCWPGPGPTADLDLVLIGPGGSRLVLGSEGNEELALIGDEVSWFCGLKPNLSSCTYQPRIMSGEALWLESTAFDTPGTSPLPTDLLAGFGYPGLAVNLYSNGFWNMAQFMAVNAAGTWGAVTNTIATLKASGFPGLGDASALSNWMASARSARESKFVVASIMQSIGVGPQQDAPPTSEQIAFVSDGTNKWTNWDIYVRDLASGATTQLTTNSAIDNHPDLSPDGQWVVFSSTRFSFLGEFDLCLGDVTNVEATVRQLTSDDHPNGPQTSYPDRHPHFHPNGKMVLFTSKNRPLDTTIQIASECSTPIIITPPRYYEGLNVIELDETGNRTSYVELDIRDAWDQIGFPTIWVTNSGTYVGHPSFSHAGNQIVFSGAIDGQGKDWEVYTVGFNPATVSLVPNSLRRVTKGPNLGPNPIKMTAGAHFSHDDTQILFSSTRTALGNSQIFRLPATALDTPVTSALQLTSHPGNDYVPEALMDGGFVIVSDLGTNGLCNPGPGPTADLDLVLIDPFGERNPMGDEAANEMILIGDEVSWFCGLKPNLSSCTFTPRIMSGEALWLESSAWYYTMRIMPATPIPSNLLSGFGYSTQAIRVYALGWLNMDAYMHANAPATWSQAQNCVQALNSPPFIPFPGLTNQSLLQNWLAQTALYRKQKFVVSSIMYDVGVGASLPTAPRLNVTRSPNAVVLSWPTYWVGHNLESSTGFEPPTSWRPVTPSPTLVGGSNIFTGTIGAESEFFRLKY